MAVVGNAPMANATAQGIRHRIRMPLVSGKPKYSQVEMRRIVAQRGDPRRGVSQIESVENAEVMGENVNTDAEKGYVEMDVPVEVSEKLRYYHNDVTYIGDA